MNPNNTVFVLGQEATGHPDTKTGYHISVVLIELEIATNDAELQRTMSELFKPSF